MADEPTLYHGDEGKDGWVEYLQKLLEVNGFSMHGAWKIGKFDDATLSAVEAFQVERKLKGTKGIVGDQTWSALRGEETLREPGDDGLAPHTYKERGVEMRFTNQIKYFPSDDMLIFHASSVGDTHPQSGTIQPFVWAKPPSGNETQMTVNHLAETDLNHAFDVKAVTAGVPGFYSFLIQLPQETGGDSCEFQFHLKDDGTVDQPD